MTIAAAQARLMTLTMYKSDLEYRMMSISNQKQALALQSAAYAQAYAEAGGTDSLENDPYMLSIQYQDKALEMEQKTLETQQKSADANLESVQKILDNNIKKDFKINFGS